MFNHRIYTFLLVIVVFLSACEFKLKPNEEGDQPARLQVQRYDRLESRYLTTGDFSALQQMNTTYPIQTRTLIEDMLQLGEVSDPEINSKFLNFYQDTTLQTVIADVQTQYADMDDINEEFDKAFSTLKTWIPSIEIPLIYSQIGALNQSVVVGNELIGISLDKYLGSDYAIYKRFDYSPSQLQTMKRSYIVPDCLTFFLLSLYPLKQFDQRPQEEKDLHMGKVMWTVNNAMGEQKFKTDFTKRVDQYMKKHPNMTVKHLLESEDYSVF
ncbi:MAG: gliding motility protein GldB [Prevotella sp.]|nr:gliding motility protein GldB [Prevotella sp.]